MYKFNEEKLRNSWELERKPNAAISWRDNMNCIPITDLRSWQMALANLCGEYGNIIEFNSKTFTYILKSNQFKTYSQPDKADKILYGIDALKDLLWAEPEIIIDNNISDGIMLMNSIDNISNQYKHLEAQVY